MRTFFGLLGFFVLLAGCGGNGSDSVTTGLAGRWASINTVPGSGTDLTLQANGSQITGTGDYRIEAGRSGTLQVTGSGSGILFILNLNYDSGVMAVFQGQMSDANHLTGTVRQTGFDAYTLTLVRQ
jgi:hypothetical protein